MKPQQKTFVCHLRNQYTSNEPRVEISCSSIEKCNELLKKLYNTYDVVNIKIKIKNQLFTI